MTNEPRETDSLGSQRRAGRTRLAKLLPLAGCLAVPAALFWLTPYLLDRLPGFAYPFDDRPFRHSVWHATPDQRGPMTDDLIRKHLKPGTPRAEVRKLLGEPDQKWSPAEGGPADIYTLGSWSGFRMDGDYLTVEYDSNGRVVGAYHWQS